MKPHKKNHSTARVTKVSFGFGKHWFRILTGQENLCDDLGGDRGPAVEHVNALLYTKETQGGSKQGLHCVKRAFDGIDERRKKGNSDLRIDWNCGGKKDL